MKIVKLVILFNVFLFAIDYSNMSINELLKYRTNTVESEVKVINKILYSKISIMNEKQLSEFYKPIKQTKIENPDLMGCEDPYCKTLERNR